MNPNEIKLKDYMTQLEKTTDDNEKNSLKIKIEKLQFDTEWGKNIKGKCHDDHQSLKVCSKKQVMDC